jgi:hypothetical protein
MEIVIEDSPTFFGVGISQRGFNPGCQRHTPHPKNYLADQHRQTSESGQYQ